MLLFGRLHPTWARPECNILPRRTGRWSRHPLAPKDSNTLLSAAVTTDRRTSPLSRGATYFEPPQVLRAGSSWSGSQLSATCRCWRPTYTAISTRSRTASPSRRLTSAAPHGFGLGDWRSRRLHVVCGVRYVGPSGSTTPSFNSLDLL